MQINFVHIRIRGSQGKLVQIKTWEIELLDDKSEELGMMLWDSNDGIVPPNKQALQLVSLH